MANRDVEYLVSTAKPGSTMSRQGVRKAIERLHPAYRSKLAKTIREARAKGLDVGVNSSYRAPSWKVGGFKDKRMSMHAYGAATDIEGIGGPGSKNAKTFYEIATKNGIFNPYAKIVGEELKYSNPVEYNHYQMLPQKVAPKAWRDALGKGKPPATQADLEKIWGLTGVDFNDTGTGPDPSDPFGVAAFQEARDDDIYPAPGPIAAAMAPQRNLAMTAPQSSTYSPLDQHMAERLHMLRGMQQDYFAEHSQPGRVSDEFVQPMADRRNLAMTAPQAGSVGPTQLDFEQAGDTIRDNLRFYDYDRKPALTEADVAANARQNSRGQLLAGTKRPLDFDPANLPVEAGSFQPDVPEDQPSYPVVSSGTRVDPGFAALIRAQTRAKENLANTLPSSDWRKIQGDTGPIASLIEGIGNATRSVGDTIGQATTFAKGIFSPDSPASQPTETQASRIPDRTVRPAPLRTDVYDVPTRVLTAAPRPAPAPQKPAPSPGPIRRALEPLKSVNVGPPPGSRVGVPGPQPNALPMSRADVDYQDFETARAMARTPSLYQPPAYQVKSPLPIPRMSPIAPAAPAPIAPAAPAEIPAQAPGPLQKLLQMAAPMAATAIGGPLAGMFVKAAGKMFPGILRDALNYDPVTSYNRAISSGVSPSDMVGGNYGGSSYGRKQSDGSVTGTTRSGSGWTSRDGGREVSVNGRTYTQNRNGRGYSLNL